MHHSSQGIYKKNILSKSLNVEVFKSTLGILLIFFFLVVSSRFVGYFEQASEGLIEPNLIYKIIILRFPDFITLLMPLSFFLGVVITVSRLYAESEIYGYISGGLSQNSIIRYLIPQAFVFFFITITLSIYIAPYTKELSKEIISIDTIEEQIESIKPKNILALKDNDGFIYVENKNEDTLEKSILFLSEDNSETVILANILKYNKLNSSIELEFKAGSAYQNIFNKNPSIISEFGELKIPLENNESKISGLSLSKLFDYSSKSTKSQIQWNISIPLTIFILLVLGVHIAKVEPRQGRLSVMLPAVFIYIFYLSLLILARESFIESSKDTHNYIWLVHTLFLSLGLFSIFKLNFYKKLQFIDSIKKSNILKIVLLVAICLIFLWISK
tara:strand:+ start:628 stop:1788 length:1161 start_codon:yes stop_codon:yes gene_type:complete